jgi:pimeloyl-ACP methyl ester carboxylesterase
MIFSVNGQETYCYTGGKPIRPGLPFIAFIHGAQNDHSVWLLQSRYFAHHGFNVLAVDLPGHGRSKGRALASVEEMADWLLALLDAAGASRAMLAGHSMGSLIALETAARAPDRVSHLALLSTAFPMKVSDALLQTAKNDEPRAFDMVNIWSHSTIAAKPAFPGPGAWLHGGALRLKERIARRNPEAVFFTDFSACNAYAGGLHAAARIRCPALFLLAKRDQMTPAKGAAALLAAIPHARQVVLEHSGHEMMAEQPDRVLDALVELSASP